MVIEFVDTQDNSAHSAFQEWRTRNQDGVFLAMRTRWHANLHGVRCFHLGSGPPYYQLEDGFGSLIAKRKICGSKAELFVWAESNGVAIHKCDHCVRDNFISDGVSVGDNSELTLEKSFSHAQVFPIVARLILSAAKHHPNSPVRHHAIVKMLLVDKQSMTLIAHARKKSTLTSDQKIAANMVAWFSQQITVGRSEWADLFEREVIGGAWAYWPITASKYGKMFDSEITAIEGEPRMFLHYRRERNSSLAQMKRESARNADGQLECEVCGFIGETVYSDCLVGDVCEVHHRKPLGQLLDVAETCLDDLAILCPNCHRAIHRTTPMMSVEELRKRIQCSI
jgi:HNH endonuclease